MSGKIKLHQKETVVEQCLLVEGLSRAGKMLVAPLVTNLKGIEYANPVPAVDHVPILWHLGVLDTDNAVAYLRMCVDVAIYDRMVGRNLNTRLTDVYTVHRSLEAPEIVGRGFCPEGKAAVDAFNAKGFISSFITHEMLPHAQLWFQAYPGVRILNTVRHPVDVAHSWLRKGWGDRWGNDPLAFIPVPETENGPVPWFALPFVDDYHRGNAEERILLCVLKLQELYDEAYAALTSAQREQTLVVGFEDIAVRPLEVLDEVATWLGTSVPANIGVPMARERVPRVIDHSERGRKAEDFRKAVPAQLFDRLMASARAYEERWGLPAA